MSAPGFMEDEPSGLRSSIRYEALRELVMVLCTYEMPIDRVRLLLDKVSDQVLVGFPDLHRAGPRAELAGELLERFLQAENALVVKARAAQAPPLVPAAKAAP